MRFSKNKPDDLAIFGGDRLFPQPKFIGRPNIGDRTSLFNRLNTALDRKWLTNDGPILMEMEDQFAQFFQVKHCIAVANATLGLQLLAKALDLRGDILLPSFTFIGTARAMEWQNLTPRFCDVLNSSHSLDPQSVRQQITPKTAAILGVHLWGLPCAIDDLQQLADQHALPLLFDSAHALGSWYKGRKISSFGRAEVFSLHATKIINALEGGLITTNDDDLAETIKLARNYGIVDDQTYQGTGINAKMNEFSAAMALTNLEHYDDFKQHNHHILKCYNQTLQNIEGLELIGAEAIDQHSGHYAVVSVTAEFGLSRDQLLQVLVAENIYSRKYFWPGCHRIAPFNRQALTDPLPVTERLVDQVLQLPTGMQLNAEDASNISALLQFINNNSARIKRQLAKSYD